MHTRQDDNKVINQQNTYDAGGLSADDPLAAIKAIRLEQLAQCRLKTQKEVQADLKKINPKR
ncbi:conserved hypothetical protein [Pseudoalteromonas sp. 3J6]|uniref:hypothetical protein n=1 Tax=unclassified Pseudoalteromonas TaxID=194690 RepID=UPI0015B85119|nr:MULTISPECIES: hypothetical protein [unclassified Pseudoalteromonas]NWL16475.1 hypothetical protein [Pseudoalteromonas sp. Scap03]QLE81590.1 hypothetical protein FLM54_08570 [Pseudoalteromonas sp. Scap25]QLE89534.1 hypothetical protein FLM47_08565 [Pseudoalteromonas sp. Scap06]CAD2224745.1 conserved hypothetical protein [Pseudoalteromonas sp. 3J6]